MRMTDNQKNWEESLKNHNLSDLERILVVNNRKDMDPAFYQLVERKIRRKKANPLVFIRYYWQALIPIIISLVSLWISIIAITKDCN